MDSADRPLEFAPQTTSSADLPFTCGPHGCWRGVFPSDAFWERQPEVVLDRTGVIDRCNRAGAALFGYTPEDLICQPISMILPQLTQEAHLSDGQPTPRLHFLCSIGYNFKGVGRNGELFPCELYLHVLERPERLRLIVRRV